MAQDTRLREAATTERTSPAGRRNWRSPLSTLTAAALFGAGLIFLLIMIQSGGFAEVDLLVLTVLLMASAALAATRLRWGPLPGGVFGLLLTAVSPLFQEFSVYHLTHPQQLALFIGTLLLHAFGLIAAVAGLAATWQNYRRPARQPGFPRWTVLFLTGLTGVFIGALALGGAFAAGAVVADTSSAATATGPVSAEEEFIAADIEFAAAPTQTTAGDIAITLVNDGQLQHNVAFDAVDGGTPVVEAAPGQTATGTVSLEAGTYTYFCTVPGHREAGMAGELTAQP